MTCLARKHVWMIACLLAVAIAGGATFVAAAPIPLPSLNIGIGTATKPGEVATTIQIFLLLTVLSLASKPVNNDYLVHADSCGPFIFANRHGHPAGSLKPDNSSLVTVF